MLHFLGLLLIGYHSKKDKGLIWHPIMFLIFVLAFFSGLLVRRRSLKSSITFLKGEMIWKI